MTPLLAHLLRRIEAEGTIGVDAFMEDVLGHPEHGYYMTGDPLGRAGDFVTAPEVSQMFGELVGLWCALIWTQMGRPARVNLVELGPGRGTLMADALRAVAGVEGFLGAVEVHLVETSPSLTQRQSRNLSTVGCPISWHRSIAEVPSGPLLVIANEFLDALPIQQFVKTASGWAERRIAAENGRLIWVEVPTLVAPPIPAPPGGVVEISPIRDAAVAEVVKRIARDGGAALFIDYGHGASAAGDTLQAVKEHRYHDVLADPGTADVTSHVDFAAVARAARGAGAATHGPVTQGNFLRALGIEARARMLARGKSPREAGEVLGGMKRLTGAKEMGDLFKVLAIVPTGTPAPEGFGG